MRRAHQGAAGERAHEFLTRDELDAVNETIGWDPENRLWIVNGRAGVGLGSPRKGGIPGTMRVITNAGSRVKHDIQRAFNVLWHAPLPGL